MSDRYKETRVLTKRYTPMNLSKGLSCWPIDTTLLSGPWNLIGQRFKHTPPTYERWIQKSGTCNADAETKPEQKNIHVGSNGATTDASQQTAGKGAFVRW